MKIVKVLVSDADQVTMLYLVGSARRLCLSSHISLRAEDGLLRAQRGVLDVFYPTICD